MNADKEPNEGLTADGISGAGDTHPVGTGVGAVGGAVAGAALGSAAGPMGSLTGAMIGTVVGAIAGKGIAEGVNPEAEEKFWKENYQNESYHKPGHTFDDYGPAYQLGWKRYSANDSFTSAEAAMEKDWATERGPSTLEWSDAKPAAKAGWDRIHHTLPKKN